MVYVKYTEIYIGVTSDPVIFCTIYFKILPNVLVVQLIQK